MFKLIDGQRTDFSKETEALLQYTPLPKDIIDNCIKPQFEANHPMPSEITLTLDNYLRCLSHEFHKLWNYYFEDYNYVSPDGGNLCDFVDGMMNYKVLRKIDKDGALILRYDKYAYKKFDDQCDSDEVFPISMVILREWKIELLIHEDSGYCVLFRKGNKDYAKQQLDALIHEREAELNDIYDSIHTLYA